MNHAARISHSPCVQFQFQVQFRCEGGTNAAEAWGRRNVLCDETATRKHNEQPPTLDSTRPLFRWAVSQGNPHRAWSSTKLLDLAPLRVCLRPRPCLLDRLERFPRCSPPLAQNCGYRAGIDQDPPWLRVCICFVTGVPRPCGCSLIQASLTGSPLLSGSFSRTSSCGSTHSF